MRPGLVTRTLKIEPTGIVLLTNFRLLSLPEWFVAPVSRIPLPLSVTCAPGGALNTFTAR